MMLSDRLRGSECRLKQEAHTEPQETFSTVGDLVLSQPALCEPA